LLVDKAPETMAAVSNRDQFHGAEAGGGETSTINRSQMGLAFRPTSSGPSGSPRFQWKGLEGKNVDNGGEVSVNAARQGRSYLAIRTCGFVAAGECGSSLNAGRPR
jgi:hypothetical protein